MRKPILFLAIVVVAAVPAYGQNALQQKGVTYYGQPAAQQIYAQPQGVSAGQPAGQVPYQYPRLWQRPGMYIQSATGRGASRLLPNASAPRQTGQSGASAATKAASAGSTFNFEVISQGFKRQAIVHLPPSYNPGTPMPVILAFHGMGMTGAMMPPLTLLDLSADRYGFINVYPSGLNQRWDNGMMADQSGDVEFVEDLLTRLPKVANIDNNRVYACGISDGGYFIQRLVCDSRHRFAGIAVVASASVAKVCARCNGPTTPAMFFLGTLDPLVPREGESRQLGALGEALGIPAGSLDGGIGKLGGLNSAAETVDFWVRKNGAGSPRTRYMPDRANDGCKVKFDDYGSGRSEVAVYTIEGGGHTWPGGLGIAKGTMGQTTQDISASDLMCEFFRSH